MAPLELIADIAHLRARGISMIFYVVGRQAHGRRPARGLKRNSHEFSNKE